MSGSRTPFSKTMRGKLESVVDTVLLEDSDVLSVVVVVEEDCLVDFFLADFVPIFSNAFKFLSVRRARFGGLSALVSTDLSGLRFRV